MAISSADFLRKKQDKWIERFYKSGPRQQHQLLLELLEQPAPFLDSEAMAYAAGVVCQQLARNNRLGEERELVARLAAVAPEARDLIQPAWALQLLLDALYEERYELLPPLLEDCLGRFEAIGDAQWMSFLDALAYHGQGPLSAQLAHQLADKLGPEVGEARHALDEAVVQHILNHAFEVFLASPRDDKALRAMARQTRGICDKSEVEYYARELRTDPAAHLLSMERSLRAANGDDVLFYGHLDFGQWLLPRGINLLTSLAMMQHAIELWELAATVPSFRKWVEISREQLTIYFHELEEAPAAEAMSAVVLAWGMPFVYAWLHERNLCSARYLATMQAYCLELQQELIQRRGPCLWSYDFVHRWGCPPGMDEAAFAAQAALFAATRSQSTPLSEDPGENLAPPFVDSEDDLLDVEPARMSGVELLALLQQARFAYGDEALGVVIDHLLERLPEDPGRPRR